MNTQTDYPHEQIQRLALEHLICALELVENYEIAEGKEARQAKLRAVISDYLATLEAIASGQPIVEVAPLDDMSRWAHYIRDAD